MNKDYILYLLFNKCNDRSYLGTININNIKENILVHNNFQKNKCKYTKIYKENGEWNYYLLIKNLYKYEALNLERLLSNKMLGNKSLSIIERREKKLLSLLSLFPNSELLYYNK